jgi:hypothetical protein
LKVKILILIIVAALLAGIIFAACMTASRENGSVPDTVLEAGKHAKDMTGTQKNLE